MSDKYGNYKLHLLRHALGLQREPFRLSDSYRNYFVSDFEGKDYEALIALVQDGLMRKREQFGQNVFHVTEAGKEYVLHHQKTDSQDLGKEEE